MRSKRTASQRQIAGRVGSRASPLAALVNDEDPRTTGTFGRYGSSSYVELDRDSSSWKMSPHFSPTTKAGRSAASSLTWPVQGMTRNGRLWLPETSERPTSGNECGSSPPIPTPSSEMAFDVDPEKVKRRRQVAADKHGNNGFGLTLGQWWSMLPTPTVGDSRNSRNATAGRSPGREAHGGTTLSDWWRKPLPTPTSRDWKDGAAEACKNVPVNSLLGRLWHTLTDRPGRLHPTFVEWMMGFPIGHTDLEP